MKKAELPITSITFEDFKRLKLVGYRLTRKYYNEHGQKISEAEGIVEVPEVVIDETVIKSHYARVKNTIMKICWEKVNLIKEVENLIEFHKDKCGDIKCEVALAIHIEPKGDIESKYVKEDERDIFTGKLLTKGMRKELAFQRALNDYCYSDPMTLGQTYMTFLIQEKLYSTRDYYESSDGWLKIPKRYTKAIYLIRW